MPAGITARRRTSSRGRARTPNACGQEYLAALEVETGAQCQPQASWLVRRRIVPHIPVRDASERDDGTFSHRDFCWDRRRGVYICPNNKVLHTTGKVHDGSMLRYRASKFDCDLCALKTQCCPNMPARQVPRDVHEYARDVTRRLMRTKAFLKSRDQRKRVEMRFAHLKVQHGFERMRLRDLSGARDEFLLAAIVQKLKTLALRAHGPPPTRRRLSLA